MADDYRTFESSGGGTAARIDALLELTTELLALDDRKALARVSSTALEAFNSGSTRPSLQVRLSRRQTT